MDKLPVRSPGAYTHSTPFGAAVAAAVAGVGEVAEAVVASGGAPEEAEGTGDKTCTAPRRKLLVLLVLSCDDKTAVTF